MFDAHAECVDENGYEDSALEVVAVHHALHMETKSSDETWKR